jgi:large subunit ribosomal protein L17
LRNLVTSLIQHERISTTYAKAKEAQKAAEKVITKAKRSIFDSQNQQSAQAKAFLYSVNKTMPRLEELARRFQERPGGYTRVHLHGNRQGDNAPRALLEIVDSPENDLKLDLTAMAMGRETFLRATRSGPSAVEEEIASMTSRPLEEDERLNEMTRLNAAKVVRFRGEEGRVLLRQKAKDHFYKLMATRDVMGDRDVDSQRWESMGDAAPRGETKYMSKPMRGLKRYAGMRKDLLYSSGPDEPRPSRDGRKNSVIRIGKGAFARRQNSRVRMPVVSTYSSSRRSPSLSA